MVWIEVRNGDLPVDLNPDKLVADRLAAVGLEDAVALVTSRTLSRRNVSQASIEARQATCLATVGLSNGERVGERVSEPVACGTINMLVHVSCPLSDGAMIELVSLAASARTAAVLDAGIRRSGIAVTGTGTDCIVVACPASGHRERYAGMHTAIGEAVGACAYRAIRDGAETWRADFEAFFSGKDAAE